MNNKYIDNYAPNQESNYIMYFDVNNLYGHAMQKPLPYGNFRWMRQWEINTFKILNCLENSPKGFILEVDLEYPKELHDLHRDLLFCSEHVKPPGSKQEKILTTLYDKEKYIIHYEHLKQVVQNGLKLKKNS